MSQATLLEEIIHWSEETCRQELKSVLPKLVSHLHADKQDELIRVFKIITEMFIPHMSMVELEAECFSKVLPKVVKMFNDLVEEISSQVGGMSSQNSELRAFLRNSLQAMVQILETLSGCVRHVCSFKDSLTLETVRSLPFCILKVLKDTFLHCKESEVVYGGRMSLVTDLLQALFKEAYSLQKSLIELLDRIALGSAASEQEVSDILAAIHSLLEICSVISNLDIALHANTWKFIIRQSVKYQALLEEQLHHGDIVSCLCDDLLASFHTCLELAQQMKQSGTQENVQCPEFKLFQKTTKMCRFFANTLVHYVKEFTAFLAKSCGYFHHVYLQILSKLPPSLWSPPISSVHSGEMSSVVLVAMDALIAQLLPFRPFAEAVLAEKQPDAESGPELLFPHCLLLVNITGKLSSQPEEVLRLWCEGSRFPEDTPKLTVFQALFRCVADGCSPRHAGGPGWSPRRMSDFAAVPAEPGAGCTLENDWLAAAACSGQLRQAHLRLAGRATLDSELVAARMENRDTAAEGRRSWCFCSAQERTLLEVLLQPDTQTALLATDVWCFMARYGTAELCLHHVVLAAHLIKACPGECYQRSHLAMLLRRMMFLMTPQHQAEVAERFPPGLAENLAVWRHVLLRALSQDVGRRVERDVMSAAGAAVTGWLETGCRLGELEAVNVALAASLAVVRCEATGSESVSSVLRMVSRLWPRMCVSQVQAYRPVQCTLRLLLSICAILVQSVDSHVICQALTCLSSLLSQKCPDDVVLAALDFLSSLGKLFIPPEIQSQVLPKLSSLFSVLLANESWILHQHTLEAFSRFAEVTNHEEVISQSLTSEHSKNEVVNFLSKIVHVDKTAKERVERLKSEKSVLDRHNARLENDSMESTGDVQPCSKRSRQETSEEEEYEKYLQTAESSLKTLCTLTEQIPPPQWVTARLLDLQALITRINTARPLKT
ncbi:FIGNL1-interacting regulator of recombination and mitosis [Anguilla rostrata]|uniref:FIGNL1-interacting regulator of recombination and mitosis n=1 Tax=Anguilla rostrata TaxID=7938 RepID=UPI0030CC2C23